MWTAGQTVLDRYTLVECLGEGGGGETWAADGPHGAVAIKRIRAEDRRRFRDLMREAQFLRELQHPHIVTYREFSDRPDEDCAILVTDLVEGGDLEAWIVHLGPRDRCEVAELGLQIVAALEVLAAADVLHRDLKPTNVLVAHDGDRPRLRVADFGISRPLEDGLAQTEDRSLTPLYAAPEQHTGGTLTPATDLYALGGVLAFLATGRHPTQGGMPTGDSGLDPLLERLMALSPADRPSLGQAKAALEAIAAGETAALVAWTPPAMRAEVPARDTLAPETEPPTIAPPRAWPWLVAGLLGGGSALIGGALALMPVPPVAEPGVAAAPVAVPDPAIVVRTPEPEPEAEPPAEPRPRPAPVVARPAVLVVNSNPWSKVFVDDVPLGRTTALGARFDVTAGPHRIRLESTDGLVWEARIDVEGERRLCVNLHTGRDLGC